MTYLMLKKMKKINTSLLSSKRNRIILTCKHRIILFNSKVKISFNMLIVNRFLFNWKPESENTKP
jgi:hypothetical protein